jgi:hypothetical protein
LLKEKTFPIKFFNAIVPLKKKNHASNDPAGVNSNVLKMTTNVFTFKIYIDSHAMLLHL